MKIDRIKEKAAQNPRKSISEARISHNSGVVDSPNSRGRRERESWDGVSVVPGLPIVIDGTAALLIFGAPGLPYVSYFVRYGSTKKTRTEGTEGL